MNSQVLLLVIMMYFEIKRNGFDNRIIIYIMHLIKLFIFM